MLTRLRLLYALDERILKLCELLQATPLHEHLDQWRTGIIEGIDAVLMVFNDMLTTEDESLFLMGEQMMEGRGEVIRKIRHSYLRSESSLSDAERTNVLRVTSHAEHVFSLLAELAQEYTSAVHRQPETEQRGPVSAGSRTELPAPDGALR